MTDLLQSQNETWANDELLDRNEKRKWFLEMESTSGKDAVKTVKIQLKI